VFDEKCFARLDSRVSDMFDAGMRSMLAQRASNNYHDFNHFYRAGYIENRRDRND